MEARKMESIALTLAVVVMAVFWAGASGQSCTNALVSMSPCLNYIQGNSSTPSSSCCSALASVVSSQPQCLCQVLNGGASALGITVNQTQALALPSACKVQTPPVSQCKGGTSPPPSGSPAGTPPESPSGGESKTVPTTDNGTSDGTSAKLTLPLLFFLLFIASSISNFTI